MSFVVQQSPLTPEDMSTPRTLRRRAAREARQAQARLTPIRGKYNRADRRKVMGPRPTDIALIVHARRPMPVRPRPTDPDVMPTSGRARRNAKRNQRAAFWAGWRAERAAAATQTPASDAHSARG